MEYDKDFEALVGAFVEYQKPIYHTPINLGINEFKDRVDTALPGLRKTVRNKLIRAYKNRSWMEYEGLVRHRGNFPTHKCPGKGINVEITTNEMEVSVGGL